MMLRQLIPIGASVCSGLLALTPLERWQAARRMRGGLLLDRWFIALEVVVVLILSVVLGVVIYNRVKGRQIRARKSFNEGSDKSGLSTDERNLEIIVSK